MTLPTRALGPYTVSSIGLGCMNLNHAYGTPPSAEDAAALLNRALDLGVTLLDTAALYGNGENERLVANAVRHRKGAFTLTSKCVLDMIEGKRGLDGSPAAIVKTVEGSLARLGTDHIALVYLHRLDRNVPVEESVGAIGLSEMSAATIRRAHAVHPIAAVQSEYSPMVRNPEMAVLETCREIGAAFVAFSPIARGLLAGAVRDDRYETGDIRATMPRFREPQLTHNLHAVRAYDALAADLGLTPAQLALAWTLARGAHVVPIPGTRSIAHLEEDVAAATVTLAAETLRRIDAIFAPGALRGARYSAAMQAQIDTETLPGEELA